MKTAQVYGRKDTERRDAEVKAIKHPFNSNDIRVSNSNRTSVKPTEQDLHKVIMIGYDDY